MSTKQQTPAEKFAEEVEDELLVNQQPTAESEDLQSASTADHRVTPSTFDPLQAPSTRKVEDRDQDRPLEEDTDVPKDPDPVATRPDDREVQAYVVAVGPGLDVMDELDAGFDSKDPELKRKDVEKFLDGLDVDDAVTGSSYAVIHLTGAWPFYRIVERGLVDQPEV